MSTIEAQEVPLGKVFSSEFEFRIPHYQRPYAWEKEQVTQLLEDLFGALGDGNDEPYFLGSLVLVKEKSKPYAEVIDGQQRLTTLTILLAVLRELSADEDLATELDRMIVEPGSIVRGLTPRPRLTLRARDDEFFQSYVQTRGQLDALFALDPTQLDSSSQFRILDNTRTIRDHLAEQSEEDRLALAKLLGSQTFLVAVSTPSIESAHRVFSVMNARGLDLSPTDIFKSKTIGEIDSSLEEKYTTLWEDAEEELGRDGFVELFLHIRTLVSKERARRELLKEFPAQVLDAYLPDRAAQFIEELLLPYADAYGQLGGGSFVAAHGASEINAWLRRLDQLDHADWKPAAMWAIRHWGNDPEILEPFLRSLERLAASLFIRRLYTTQRLGRYIELVRELEQGAGLDAPALDLSDEERADTLSHLNGDVYLVRRTRRYILLRLDELLAAEPGVSYSHDLISIEHVLPQSPASGSEWTELFDEEQREHWTHRLANLVLLNRRKNSEASRRSFERKREGYFISSTGVATFALTSQVLAHETWTPEILEQRQTELITLLRDEWRL